MKERINAFWQKHFGADLFTADGTDVAIEEAHVEGLEEISGKLEALEADNTQLKAENQTHAESIAEMETAAAAALSFQETVRAALVANNVELAEGADVAAIAAEKINAWGASVPPATPVSPTDGDDLGDGKDEAFLTEIDKRARAKRSKK